MPTSSAIPPSAVAAAEQSPAASDSEEYEYEEVEIEEEVEVEEEVSDEDEDENEEEEEKESGEDLSQSIENPDDEKRKKTLISGDDKALQCDGGMMSAETINPFNESSKEVTGGVSVTGLTESNKIPPSEEETTHMCAKDVNDAKQVEPRLDDPLIRARSLSPAVETNEGNKRPALICEFFAKGWCIKGNSCRFRHIRDSLNASDQKNESSVAAYQKREHQDDEGVREGIGRSGLATSAAPPTATCSREVMQLQESKESPNRKNESSATISSFGDVGKKGILENQYLDKENPPVNANSLFETSSNMFMNSDIHRSNWVSSYATSTEDLGGRGYQFGIHSHKLPNYSSSSFQSTRFSPSNLGSMWPRTSMLSSSWNSDSFNSLKHVSGDREHHLSLRPTGFSFSGSESEHLHRTNEAPLHLAGFTTKFPTYDWEPSKPFRSSFLISQGISSQASQYDPIRDSIEPPKTGDKFSRFSSNQAPSISSTRSPMKANPPQKDTFGMDFCSDRFSLASNANSNDNAVDVTSEKGAVDTKQENSKSESKGKKQLTPVHVGDVTQASELHVSRNFMGLTDEPRKEITAGDEGSQYHKPDFDAEQDGALHRESKALRHFRAALIEFVKELVKPTWRDGKLSKDAHKLIVKKAVDRVLSSLPAEHIPSMQESIDMYLSSSQPKIMKLVEGYIEKYGKV